MSLASFSNAAIDTALQFTALVEATSENDRICLGQCLTLADGMNDDEEDEDSANEMTGDEKEQDSCTKRKVPFEPTLEDFRRFQEGWNECTSTQVFEYGPGFEDFKIKIDYEDIHYNGSLSELLKEYSWTASDQKEVVQCLWTKAPSSGYGDMKEMETKFDTSVRNAKELLWEKGVTAEKIMIQKISELWSDHMSPKDVRVEPYKMNIYGPGGHFQEHRDTPEKDLVGTFLVGLGDTSDSCLTVDKVHHWRSKAGSWCAFYPDVGHKIDMINSGYRATLAFKVFSDKPEAIPNNYNVRRIVDEMLSQWERPYGFILHHKYSLADVTLKGCDCTLQSLLSVVPGTRLRLVPVVVKYKANKPYEEKTESYTGVYPILAETVLHCENGKKAVRLDVLDPDIQALCGSDTPFFEMEQILKWKHEETSAVAYTGNNSENGSVNSVYIAKALLVLDSTNKRAKTDQGSS